ncbi:N-acetylglucosamine 6-phosphate deacetylase [Isoptericola jiangsuensis]|uniref:N-acetylglucosamine 6-phosphate deacetylase n=1 Tax=Isoptericola jiangsuensis TaxID=548579 RepID=A0A2A9EYY6_9MICO|nr:amidohydrolase family protein [Isoptericola jiangsuensis]PFG43973.1 N-acetylglucosamine 6-phosphate deacetylase [Isoptericola jiangsuensis]
MTVEPADRTGTPAAPEVFAVRGDVVVPDAVVPDAAVVVADDRIVWVGPLQDAVAAGLGDVVAAAAEPVPGTLVLPGLVDLHDHGGGGAGFPDATTREAVMTAVLEHRRHGTTTMLASLVTADADTLLERTALLADLADAGEIEGIHAEGPFLSPVRRGAHDPELLQTGDVALVRRLVEAGRGHLRTMTVAPDVDGVAGPGGVAAALVQAGVVPSLGHTDATTQVAEDFVREVVTGLAESAPDLRMTATHLFNAMRPLHHRDGGPVAACLAAAARGDLVVELVGDEVHLDPAVVRSVIRTVGADQVMLVTDAMAAAGMADGAYDLGPMAVSVQDGVARVTDPTHPEGGPIAGGTSHLLDVVRATVAAGVDLVDAVRCASWVPAGVLGLTDVGGLLAGRRADVVVTDADLVVQRVLRAGAEVV